MTRCCSPWARWPRWIRAARSTRRSSPCCSTVAAILGNTVNYSIGRAIGPRAFTGRVRFLKVEYLRQTEAFFERYGGMTIVVSRFMPIVRTFAPFVAGIGQMPYAALPGLQHRWAACRG